MGQCKHYSKYAMGWMIWYLNTCKGNTFISPKTSRPRLGTTQPLSQKIPGLLPGGKAARAWSCPLTYI